MSHWKVIAFFVCVCLGRWWKIGFFFGFEIASRFCFKMCGSWHWWLLYVSWVNNSFLDAPFGTWKIGNFSLLLTGFLDLKAYWRFRGDFQNRYEQCSLSISLKFRWKINAFDVWKIEEIQKIQILTANLNFHFFTKISNPNLCEISIAFHHPHMKNSTKKI